MAGSNTPTYNFMKGWDMIAGTKQKTVNALLQKLPNIPVDYTTKVNVFGTEIACKVQILVRAPSINVRAISGRQVDVIFPISGLVTLGEHKISLPDSPKPQSLIATLQLTQIEAELQDRKGEKRTRYDLIFDLLSKGLIVDLEYKGMSASNLATLVQALKNVLQDVIAKKQQYKVASFYLNSDPGDMYKDFIPHLADSTFVKDNDDPDESNLLVLMLTISQKRGNIFFNGPILPKDVEYILMINNHLFLQEIIYPQLVENVKKEAKNPNAVPNIIVIQPISATRELWEIHNTQNIDLAKDHDPWISALNCKIDQTVDQLMLHLDVRANVTFLEIHVNSWDTTYLKLENDNGKIKIEKASESSGHSSSMEWWKWLLSFLTFIIGGIIAAIIYAIVSSNVPSLNGTFASAATTTVEWPYQKSVAIKDVQTPGHIVFVMDVRI